MLSLALPSPLPTMTFLPDTNVLQTSTTTPSRTIVEPWFNDSQERGLQQEFIKQGSEWVGPSSSICFQPPNYSLSTTSSPTSANLFRDQHGGDTAQSQLFLPSFQQFVEMANIPPTWQPDSAPQTPQSLSLLPSPKYSNNLLACWGSNLSNFSALTSNLSPSFEDQHRSWSHRSFPADAQIAVASTSMTVVEDLPLPVSTAADQSQQNQLDDLRSERRRKREESLQSSEKRLRLNSNDSNVVAWTTTLPPSPIARDGSSKSELSTNASPCDYDVVTPLPEIKADEVEEEEYKVPSFENYYVEEPNQNWCLLDGEDWSRLGSNNTENNAGIVNQYQATMEGANNNDYETEAQFHCALSKLPTYSLVEKAPESQPSRVSSKGGRRQLIKPSRILCHQLRQVMPLIIRQFNSSAASRKGLCRQLTGQLYPNSPKPSPNFLLNTLLPVYRAAEHLGFDWGYNFQASLSYLRSWVLSQNGGKDLVQRFRIEYNAPTGKGGSLINQPFYFSSFANPTSYDQSWVVA